MTALIGHTGSGKSTLIQHINALLLPTSGQVQIEDILITATNKPSSLKPLRKKQDLFFNFPNISFLKKQYSKILFLDQKTLESVKKKPLRLLKT